MHDFWDRGLLGLAIDPQFPTRPYVHVLYTYDHVLGSSNPSPCWGDGCPNPPGATEQGCVVSGRLSRLTADSTGRRMVPGSERVVIQDWCQQFPSHSVGDLAFGPDGALYVGGGDGASFNYLDHGQTGNPCGDPWVAPASATTRGRPALPGPAQLRRPGHPGRHGHPHHHPTRHQRGLAGRRRLGTWEEINRILPGGAVEDFGWPCSEGDQQQPGYHDANLAICNSLASSQVTRPVYRWQHGGPWPAVAVSTPGRRPPGWPC